MNEITIRQEESADFKVVFDLIEKAFKSEKFSDHKEQFLVERLRTSKSFIPKLSLVAVIENKIVGHILLTKQEIPKVSSYHGSFYSWTPKEKMPNTIIALSYRVGDFF